MLSGCANLEWLSFIRCHVDDALKVKQPLRRLLYLRVAYCRITKLELRAVNLKTFVFHGTPLPIDLGQVNQLETAELRLYCFTLEYVITVLPDILVGVQSITLRTCYLPLEVCSCSIFGVLTYYIVLSDCIVSFRCPICWKTLAVFPS